MPHFAATRCGPLPNNQCAFEEYRLTHLGECPDDIRCSDPEFAADNPGLCLLTPRLVIKPSAAVVEVLDDVQYKAFLWIDGQEEELTTGVIWSVQDIAIALAGAGSGNVTGVAVGITNVIATYGGMTGMARLEVVAEGACAVRANHYAMVLDVSRSSGGAYVGVFGSRLDVAKSLAQEFINNTNFDKDEAAVISFNTTTAAVHGFSQDGPSLLTSISALASTALNTNLAEALNGANDYFDSQGIPSTGRVLMLFSDGENNTGSNPIAAAEIIKGSGTIILVVGLRAKGAGFQMLQKIASGGFFINVLNSNIAQADGYLNGLRQYLCSSNCPPVGGVTLGVGQLNYDAFAHWDVISGDVDLIGQNEGGPALFDFLPGYGLYLDGCGSSTSAPPDGDRGTIRSLDRFVWEVGKSYRITVQVAGNQREAGIDKTTIRALDPSDAVIAQTVVTVGDYIQPFTDFTVVFSPLVTQAGGVGGKIEIEQTSIRGGGTTVFGNLWNTVTLDNLTDNVTMFVEEWDDENAQFIDPRCPEGSGGFGYGAYCPGQGCIDGSIPAQFPDPNPLLNMEGEQNAPVV